MIRHCIVSEGVVANVTEYPDARSGWQDGLEEGSLVVPSDEAQIGWLWDGSVFTDSAPAVIDPRQEILSQIAALEATVTNRRLREAALSDAGKAWLADADAQIAALRASL